MPEEGMAQPEAEEVEESAPSAADVPSEDEMTEKASRKRSRTPEDLEATADSSPSASTPPEGPANVMPLKVVFPVKTLKKRRVGKMFCDLTDIST